MFGKVKSSLAKKLGDKNGVDKTGSIPNSSTHSPNTAHSPPLTAPSSPSLSSKAVRTAPKSLSSSNVSLTSKLKQVKNKTLKSSSSDLTWTEDFELENAVGGNDSVWNFPIAKLPVDLPTIITTNSQEFSSGITSLNLSKERASSLSSARIQLTNALLTFNEGKTSRAYLETFEAITTYLSELHIVSNSIDHNLLYSSPGLEVTWSCGLSRKKADGVVWSRPSIKFPGIFADRPFTLLALAGLLVNWAASTPLTPEEPSQVPVASRRYLKAASVYQYLSQTIDTDWPSHLERPFDVTSEACKALAHVAFHQAELVGYQTLLAQPGKSDRLEGILANVAGHLSDAHNCLMLAPAAQTGAAKGIVQFVEDGTRLYRGLALLRQARRYEQADDRRAFSSASRAKQTLQAASSNDRSHPHHVTLLTKFTSYASQLKAQLGRIDKAVSAWDTTNPDSASTDSQDVFPTRFALYSPDPITSSDLTFSSPPLLPTPPTPPSYLLQHCYY